MISLTRKKKYYIYIYIHLVAWSIGQVGYKIMILDIEKMIVVKFLFNFVYITFYFFYFFIFMKKKMT